MISGKRIFISCAIGLALVISISALSATSDEGAADDPSQLYEAARSLAERGKYRAASKIYRRIAEDFPGSPIAAESKFRQAECLELMKNYYRAFKVYQELLERFPSFADTSEVLDRQLGIGIALMNRKRIFSRNLSRAREIFRRIVQNAPFGETAPMAQFNLAVTHEMSKSYSEAIMEHGKVISSYPGSDVIDDADYHLALCHYTKAKRAPHDQSAAAKAVSALRGFIKRYPNDPKAQDAKVKLEEIAGRKATALFDIAEFYEKTGSTKSAIYYYQEVIDKYPELELARRAELKIRRSYELVKVDKHIEELSDELYGILDEMSYSRSQIKRLRRPEVRWHVWEYLRIPEGPKGERIAQEKERLSSLRKESREKKKYMRKVLAERRQLYMITSAQLTLDKAKRKHQLAQMELEAARDDRPGPDAEEDENAMKVYERNLSKKHRGMKRTGKAVARTEKSLENVKERVGGKEELKKVRIVKRSRLREKNLRRQEFREKLAELAADLSSERRNSRALSKEESKQAKLLERYRRKGMADEVAEAEAEVNLSLIASKRSGSQERISELEREIERRRKINKLERRYGVVLRRERRTEAALHRIEASAYSGKKSPFSFLSKDPVSRAVEKLDDLRRERRLVEDELSALTAGGDFVTAKEKKRRERQAELERRRSEKAEAKERRKREKELAREKAVAERSVKLEDRKRAKAEAKERRKREKELAREKAVAERSVKLEDRKRAKAGAKERRKKEREQARERRAAGHRLKLEEERSRALGLEEEARTHLEGMRGEEAGKKSGWLFFRTDPVRKAERRLERLRKRRESLEKEISALTTREDTLAQKEEIRHERLAEQERRRSEKAEAKERRKREKELARETAAAERSVKLEDRKRAKAEAKERRKREKELAREKAAAERRVKLEKEHSSVLEQEQEAGKRLEELRVKGSDEKKKAWHFFLSDPIRKAERRLERLGKRRESLERELGLSSEEIPAAVQ